MDRSEFRALIFPLTDFEKNKKNSKDTGLPAEFESVRSLWQRDENGFLVLTNKGMNEFAAKSKDALHAPIYDRSLNESFRLIIHHRFNHREFHSTEFISVNYVYSGKLTVTFPNSKDSLIIDEGGLILMNSSIVHRLQIESENDIVLGFQIEKNFLREDLLNGLPRSSMIVDFLIQTMSGGITNFRHLISDFRKDERMKNLIEDLFCEYLDPNILSPVTVASYLKLFFVKVVGNENSDLCLNRKDLIFRILAYIEENSVDISLEDLALRFNYSEKYLSRYIKNQTGRTFSFLCLKSRMEKARFYLIQSELSVDDIARKCGFTNLSFFYRKFKEYFGMMPHAMRKNATF